MCVFVSVWVAWIIANGRVNTGLDNSQAPLAKVQMLLKQKRQEVAECWQFSEKVKFKAQDIGYTVVGIKTKIKTSISDESRLMSVYDLFFCSPWLLCGTFFK